MPALRVDAARRRNGEALPPTPNPARPAPRRDLAPLAATLATLATFTLATLGLWKLGELVARAIP